MLVQRRRDTRSALRPMRKLLKKQGFVPKLLVTDKLRCGGPPELLTHSDAGHVTALLNEPAYLQAPCGVCRAFSCCQTAARSSAPVPCVA